MWTVEIVRDSCYCKTIATIIKSQLYLRKEFEMEKHCVYCLHPINENEANCPHCGKNLHYETPTHHITPGTVLNNKYLIGAAIGEGGFGITYIGRDVNLEIRVAVKEYYPNGYVNRNNTVSMSLQESATESRKNFFDKGKERFLSEARILARFLGEPGIVGVRDFLKKTILLISSWSFWMDKH